MKTYRLEKDYKINKIPKYYLDEAIDDTLVWQPEVYELAFQMAKKSNIKNIIDVGSGNGEKLKPFLEYGIHVHIFDFGENLEYIKNKYHAFSNLTLHECNLENSIPEIEEKIIEDSIIIASDVIEHIVHPDIFLSWLSKNSKIAKLLFISTPDRNRTRGYGSLDAPENLGHVREWDLSSFLLLLNDYGINNTIGSFTLVNNKIDDRSTLLIISGNCIVGSGSYKHGNAGAKIAVLLNFDTDSIDSYKDSISFWKNQDIELYFKINKDKNYENSLALLDKNNLSGATANSLDELDAEWSFNVNLSNRIKSPFQNISSIKDAISFIDSLGYNTIELREKKYFNNQYIISSPSDNIIKKQTAGHEEIYPLFFEIGILLNNKLPYMKTDSIQNYHENIANFLNRKAAIDENETIETQIKKLQQTIQTQSLQLDTFSKTLEATNKKNIEYENILANNQKIMSRYKNDMKEILNSKSWKLTGPLRAARIFKKNTKEKQ